MPDSCELRQRKYLNNLVEQDHREHQTAREARDGFFSCETAWRTDAGDLRSSTCLGKVR